VQEGERGYFFVCINEENGQLPGLQAEVVIKGLFLQAPGFPAQALYAVTVYGAGKMAGGGAEAYLHRVLACRQGRRHIHYPVWKNRKRFSFPKKRFNQFSAF